MRLAPALALVAVLLAAAPSAAEGPAPPSPEEVRTRLLDELSSEAAAVRERATSRLATLDELPEAELARAFDTTAPRGLPSLFRVVAARRLTALAPRIAPAVAGADGLAAEAAVRALVALGPSAVEAGRRALADAPETTIAAASRAARGRLLTALDAQHRVEHEVFSRWRRKGGSYRGRYADLADLGWEVQPVLLAMLLDVPLEESHVVVAPTGDPDIDRLARSSALQSISDSRRRGYRTFEPLPPNIEPDEVFDLAQQALCDVADLDLMREVLEETQQKLLRAHRRVQGFRPRAWEDQLAHEIEVILASRGAPDRLEERRSQLQSQVDQLRRFLARGDPEDLAYEFQGLANKTSELAAVLHQLGLFEDAARRYADSSRIVKRLTGRESSMACYNQACALARLGRVDDAFEQLAISLDPEASAGSEDLTREWVAEDGDLAPLHDDPRFAAILKRRFGN